MTNKKVYVIVTCVWCAAKFTDTSKYLNKFFTNFKKNYCKNNSLISYGEPNIKTLELKNKNLINVNRIKSQLNGL